MSKSNGNIASKDSADYAKLTEVDQNIVRRQQKADIKRFSMRNKANKPVTQTLTEEFFDGLDIA
jgi:hypothetical protein